MNALAPGAFRKSEAMPRSSLAAPFPGNSFNPPRPLWTSVRRGFARTCPACGTGELFYSYLRRRAHCADCGEALHHEAPGALSALVAAPVALAAACLLAVALDFIGELPLWAEIPLCEAFALYAAFKMLPRANGAALGLAWAVWHGDFDPHERFGLIAGDAGSALYGHRRTNSIEAG